MGRVGRKRYIEFRIRDVNSNPVLGRLLSDLQVIFTRDNVACSDVLSLVENGTGHYVLEYVPSSAGHDYLEVYDAVNDITVLDAEDVDTTLTFFGSTGLASLTQDYGSVGRFKITYPNPQSYSVYLFLSQDWQSGRTQPANAQVSTPIDTSGNWLQSPLTVASGTYHVVAMNGSGATYVMAAFLQV